MNDHTLSSSERRFVIAIYQDGINHMAIAEQIANVSLRMAAITRAIASFHCCLEWVTVQTFPALYPQVHAALHAARYRAR